MPDIETERPPRNSKRVYRWPDLPNTLAPKPYRIIEEGKEVTTFIASEHKRQVLEGLMLHPIYAASYCRISDQVLALRGDGVDIECKMTPQRLTPRQLQERRIRWGHGVSQTHAALIARLHFGGAR